MKRQDGLTSVELCAGGGGTALGLEAAGFRHLVLVERDPHACGTLQGNRPGWNAEQADVAAFDGRPFAGADLLSAGTPCTPFSGAGQKLGAGDERDLFPAVIRLAGRIGPRAVMIETADTILSGKFDGYRTQILSALSDLGYCTDWRVIECAGFVPQHRLRSLLVALRPEYAAAYRRQLPEPPGPPLAAGDALHDLMASRGWPGAAAWRGGAREVSPTIVGGSEKHGGPDLGPTGAKKAWARIGVNGFGVADQPPGPDGLEDRAAFTPAQRKKLADDLPAAMPMLTVAMGARLQGFPDDWRFSGGKGAQWGQVGNAFPAPVAMAYGLAIATALSARTARRIVRRIR